LELSGNFAIAHFISACVGFHGEEEANVAGEVVGGFQSGVFAAASASA
jgi:hypothetical protein